MAGEIKAAFNTAFRDYVTDGIPMSGKNPPKKSEIRLAGAIVQDAIDTEMAARIADKAELSAQIFSNASPPLAEVAAAQTVALPSNVYANGTAGVGATITASANGALAGSYFDSATIAAGKRLFVGLEGTKNGVYVLTQLGDGTKPWILTRATDADTADKLGLCNFAVIGGATLYGKNYKCQQKPADITVGTTALTFAVIKDDSAFSGEVVAARGPESSLAVRTDKAALQLGMSVKALRVAVASGSVTPACYRNFAYSSGVTYEHVARIKADGLPYGQLICNGAGAAYTVDFDLANGRVVGQTGANLVAATITALGSGVFECVAKLTTSAGGSANIQFRPSQAAGTFPFTGDGVAGAYVLGLEWRVSGTVTNLFPSNDPADATFTKVSLTATANQVIPSSSALPSLQATVAALDLLVNGKKVASKIVEGTGTGVDVRLYKGVTVTGGKTYEFGVDMKKGERSRFALFSNAGVAFNSVFDLRSGSGSGTGSPAAKVLGNDWVSASVSAAASSTATTNLQVRIYPDAGGPTYNPDGVSSIGLARAWLKEDGVLIWEETDFSAWTKNNLTVTANSLLYVGALANPTVTFDSGAAKLKGKKTVFLGTSITAQGNYTGALAILAGLSATNLGVSGASIGQNSHYGSLGIYNQIPNIPGDTEIVIIEAGTNDFGAGANSGENTPLGVLGDTSTASFYGALYAAVVAIRAQAPNAVIVFLSPYSSTSAFASHAIGTVNYRGNTLVQFQQAVDEVSKYTGYPMIDVGRRSRIGYFMPAAWTSDGLHVTATGGAIFAAYVFEGLLALARAGLFG